MLELCDLKTYQRIIKEEKTKYKKQITEMDGPGAQVPHFSIEEPVEPKNTTNTSQESSKIKKAKHINVKNVTQY